MKNLTIISVLLLLLISCSNDKKDIPDVSGISVDVKVERFDKDFFQIDTNNLWPSVNALREKYPALAPIYFQNILGLDSLSAPDGIRQFIQLSGPIYKKVNEEFNNTASLEKEFEKAFRFVKYYFPNYSVPKLVTIVGPVDALAKTAGGFSPDFLGPDFLGISLQFYLGKNFPLYQDPFFIENVAPAYRSRRFSKEYIIADGMQLIVDDIFPDKSAGKPLIEQMIEKGKLWYLLDKFLPETPDSIKTGYSQQQLEWCKTNEGLIWSYITKNENLNAVDMVTLQTYIGEAPFTQGFSQELSPGNLGQWIGWRIVNKYAQKNSSLNPRDIMETSARKILDEAKYKPK